MPILCAELVVDPRRHKSLHEAERALYLAFRRLKRRARRHFGHFQYFTLVEISQRGSPRILLLARDDQISRRWLSENWRECGGDRVTNVKQVICLEEFLATLHLPNLAGSAGRARAESRRKARYSRSFFDGLGNDLMASNDDVHFWEAVRTDFVLTCVMHYAGYLWIARLLQALDEKLPVPKA